MSLITKIQKYSIHDGDGIRTTIFFKGCGLKCIWCHNPETQCFQKQLMVHQERCTGCGKCETICPQNAIHTEVGTTVTDFSLCDACGTCVNSCNLNLREIVGKEYTVDELVKEIKKDEMFYEESGGGVTLSGGEVMISNMNYLETLCQKLNRIGISIFIDTCGHAPYGNFERLMPYVDTFLYDIKTMNVEIHKKYIGADNVQILSNLEKLNAAGARIYLRIPTIKGINADETSMKEIINYLQDKKINPAQIYLLPYHNTGSVKYRELGLTYKCNELTRPTEEELNRFVELFKTSGFTQVKINR